MPTLVPSSICNRRVLDTLADGRTFLVEASGRKYVLKRLEDDCLLDSQLHPSIRERLARVRELAHSRVANLHGVERDSGEAYLVWDYVDGTPWDEFVAGNSESELIRLSRDVTLAVESMHLRGIVHGSLHARNIFIKPDGSIQLTHINPLLYSDPQYDLDALVELTGVPADSLAELRARFSTTHTIDETRDPAEKSFRIRATLLVVLAALLGLAATDLAIRYANDHPAPPPVEQETRP